jgi:hypothetical protein
MTETPRVVLRVGQRLAYANRSEQGKELFIKNVEVEAKSLFRILLLATLYRSVITGAT